MRKKRKLLVAAVGATTITVGCRGPVVNHRPPITNPDAPPIITNPDAPPADAAPPDVAKVPDASPPPPDAAPPLDAREH